jgi:zinc transporter 1/2/3
VLISSVIIGLTLAVNDEFITLFVVLIFHRMSPYSVNLSSTNDIEMFEGLGLGSRLSALNLPGKWNYARYVAAIFYSICTPVGVAIGLGVRESYNGNGAKASIISGVLDATSAGILLYTGTSPPPNTMNTT